MLAGNTLSPLNLDRPHPKCVAALRQVLNQIMDADALPDEEVIHFANVILNDAGGQVAREYNLPLQPEPLPAIDPAMLADVTVIQAELHLALEGCE